MTKAVLCRYDFNFQIISRWRGVVEEYSSESDPKYERIHVLLNPF